LFFIFLDEISVDWTRFEARERYQPSRLPSQPFLKLDSFLIDQLKIASAGPLF